ncbi:basic helix-loop-helix transcription factor scleraxis-like [Portunus trituberculatus]|uniref:basic helix-loop-helix transcription factor scleraxis-like n=1 Tax=Portunus trituberculatus TaxID=210409 RepID=UPI001E1CB49B|nr:basic helix-loop-helix transcription factor scleraxis-like [Portunus trituberculatus]
MITSKMAKKDENESESDSVDSSVDNNNNSECSQDASVVPSGKYQLRPRSLKARHRCDPDWSLPEPTGPKTRPQPLSRYRRKTANARERYRMRQINTAFESLRGVLPSWVCRRRAAADMTKIATLRLASAYIRSLQDMLDGNAPQDTCAWVLSGILKEDSKPKEPQAALCHPSSVPTKTPQQDPAHTPQDPDLVTLLCGAADSGLFQDNLESFQYLTPSNDADTVTLLLLGADPPQCWGEAQHTPPVS